MVEEVLEKGNHLKEPNEISGVYLRIGVSRCFLDR